MKYLLICILISSGLLGCRSNTVKGDGELQPLTISSDLDTGIKPGDNLAAYCKESVSHYFCQVYIDVPPNKLDEFEQEKTYTFRSGGLEISIRNSQFWLEVTIAGEELRNSEFSLHYDRSLMPSEKDDSSLDLAAGRQSTNRGSTVFLREVSLQPQPTPKGGELPMLRLRKLVMDIIVDR